MEDQTTRKCAQGNTQKLNPERKVWDDIENNRNSEFENWITETDNNKANLEAQHPQFRCPLLYYAANSNNLEVVKLLVEKRADINSQQSSVQSTALHIASFWGYASITEYLLERKANPHLLNADGETAIENGKQGKKPNEIMQIYEEYFKNNPNLHDDSNESQSPESLWQLGICYSNGTYGYPKDFKKAYQSFQQGSMHGHHPSTTGLGYCYFYGLGVERDYKEAVRLYGVAASKGNVFAAYNLGTLYKSGKILPKNLNTSFEYYKKAADQGHANAQYNIGKFYDEGKGCEVNHSEAIRYWKLAELQKKKKSERALASKKIDLDHVTVKDLFGIMGINDQCGPCKLSANNLFNIHRQCKICTQEIKVVKQEIQIDLGHVTTNDLFRIMRIHNQCDPCTLTAETLFSMNRQCKICNPNLQTRETIVLLPEPILLHGDRINTPKQTIIDFLPTLRSKTWKERQVVAVQLAQCILTYHEQDRIHGNICGRNIKLLENGKWRVDEDPEKIIIEPEWCAPELVLVKNQSSKEADIFCFAFILLSIWEGETPWIALSRKKICENICFGERPRFSASIPAPEGYQAIIEKCWDQEAKNRWEIIKILEELQGLHVTPEMETLLAKNVCRSCFKPFVDNSSLERHSRSHLGFKPFPCPYELTCGKRFTDTNNVEQHIRRMHQGVVTTVSLG